MHFTGDTHPVETWGIQPQGAGGARPGTGGVNVAGVIMAAPHCIELNTEQLAHPAVGAPAQVVGLDSTVQSARLLD